MTPVIEKSDRDHESENCVKKLFEDNVVIVTMESNNDCDRYTQGAGGKIKY